MPRPIDSVMLNAIASNNVRLMTAVDIAINSNPAQNIRSHDGIGTHTIEGEQFRGIGLFGTIDYITETSSLQAQGVKLRLTGVTPGAHFTTISQPFQGKPTIIYLGILSEDNVLLSHYKLWAGINNTMNVLKNGTEILLSVDSRLIDLQRPKVSYYTTEDQKEIDPTDTGFQHVTDIGYQRRRRWT